MDVTIGDESVNDNVNARKDRPVWMTESTVITNDDESSVDDILKKAANTSTQPPVSTATGGATSRNKKDEDIMQVLLQHEKQPGRSSTTAEAVKGLGSTAEGYSSDSSDDDKEIENAEIPNVEIMESDEDEDDTPMVTVAGKLYPLDKINDILIAEMTPQEKETYIHVYQEHFSHMID